MNFREYVQVTEEEKSFNEYTLEELEVLLQHHEQDAEEYKDSDVTAYESSLKDIEEIKKAIAAKEDEEDDDDEDEDEEEED